ncbi:phosphoethanolamine--lipid A transferase [Colwellia demingiae]|uniref:Phosphoethanolamine--lipid A transferase n=2 Tax=Colwellia demingiae TaxID=89401 RepID=A0A5C6QAE5_9GAMM|nr:phosphoethanolamine--lipid A transferase [Colwellia demingiae]
MKKLSFFNCSPNLLIIATVLFIVATGNTTFFEQVNSVYPWQDNQGFIIALTLVVMSVLTIIVSCFSIIIPVRIILSVLLLFSASAGYFTDSFGTIIDNVMIQNIVETNVDEAIDLVSFEFILNIFLFAILPIICLYLVSIDKYSWKINSWLQISNTIIALGVVTISLYIFSAQFTNFFREHKPLRFYLNPIYPIYSTGFFVKEILEPQENNDFLMVINAASGTDDKSHKKLYIVIVGETVHAGNLSLNGYERETTPLLAQRNNLISFDEFYACGTSTAISVPCMFSFENRETFDNKKARRTQNVLDVIAKAGVSVLWRDNNSNSKGVADRVEYQNFKSPEVNSICDLECRDIGMLGGLQRYIDEQEGSVLIVLHQMGNHGPAYYKRYPKDYEKFTPACQTSELSACETSEIVNAYDNAILYTDNFINETINLLEENNNNFETAMFYIGDHGESLGENGLYLHGMPYMLAPEEQTHVPLIAWFGSSSHIDMESTVKQSKKKNSHDAFSYSLLHALNISTDMPISLDEPSPLFVMQGEE